MTHRLYEDLNKKIVDYLWRPKGFKYITKKW